MKLIRVLCALVVLIAQFSAAQVIVPRSPFVVNMDYSRFRYTATEGYLEVFLAVYPSLVTLRAEGEAFKGTVEVTTIIRDRSTDTVVTAQRAWMPITVKDTTPVVMRRALVSKQVFAVPVGDYVMDIHAGEVGSPIRRDSGRVAFAIDSASTATTVSDVDLCSNIESSTEKTDPFYKNSYLVIPNPSLYFGATSAPVVFTYAELYNLEVGKKYVLAMEIVDARNKVAKERTRQKTFSITNAVDVSTLNVTGIPSGKYRFVLRISDTLGTLIARSEKPMFISNPQLPQETASPTSARAAELAGMTAEDLDEEFRVAQYLTNTQDRTLYENLSTPDAKREFLAAFWTDVENGRRGFIDMTRALYMMRVRTANERYRAMSKPGWQSDRGRVFILYGEPDEIQRFPSSEDRKPYEIWNYYQLENGVIFALIDRTGFGDYVLVHSTKRGELLDEGWERYLR